VSFQVTVTNDKYGISQKIKETLEKFYENKLDETYSKKLYIFIASGFRRENDLKKIRTIQCADRYVKVEESLFTNDNVWDFTDLYKYIEQNHSKIDLEKVISICKKVDKRPEHTKFNPPKYHIPRSFTSISSKVDLIQIIKDQKRVILIGEGGLGKTTELEHIVHVLSNEGWYCYFISMVDYSISLVSTLSAIAKHWYNCPNPKRILFALDGLDEIVKDYDLEKINEIVQFGYDYQNIHILVSHKKGYQYDFRLASNNFSFCTVELDSISKESIIEFIKNEEMEDSDFLIQEFENEHLFSLCSNPFYLINLIDIFKSTGRILHENIELIEQLIEQRIEHEKIKRKAPISRQLTEREYEVYITLLKIALTMQFAEKISVSNKDFQKMAETKLRKFMPRLVLVNNNDLWKFEHSLIRDYLAAKSLSDYNWEIIKQIILNHESERVKPQWNNSYFFLKKLAIQKSNSVLVEQLNNLAIKIDYVKLLKSSDIQLSIEEKNEIFYSIYKDYREKEIVFYAEFSAQELANFCQLEENQELIDFLLSELKSEMNIQNLYNIVELFEAIKPKNCICLIRLLEKGRIQ
jgi:hypothetical protein